MTQRLLHRIAAWIVGLQVLIWFTSGLAFTLIPLGKEGLTELKPFPVYVVRPEAYNFRNVDLERAVGNGKITAITLTHRLESPAVKVDAEGRGSVLVDASGRKPLPSITAAEARALALKVAPEGIGVRSVELLTASKKGYEWDYWSGYPVWRVDLDYWKGTRIYVSPLTGEILQAQNINKRAFDLFYALHLMTYVQVSGYHNPLLITAAVLALVVALTGVWLLLRPIAGKGRN